MKIRSTKQKTRRRLLLAAAFIALLAWSLWGTTALQVTEYTITSPRLPKSFDSFTVVQISDLHNAVFGKDNEALLAKVREAQPDLVALTGDLVDSRHTDMESALRFVEQAVAIAPACYVTGNHEARLKEYPELENSLKSLGVRVLNDAFFTLERSGQHIQIAGMQDPAFFGDYQTREEEAHHAAYSLSQMGHDPQQYTLFLSHRPELFDLYKQHGMDVALTGHTHGGQLRLPLIGALLVPNQGFFPKYDAGLFVEEGHALVISRGLGNSVIPLRFNNRPEVVVVTLKRGGHADSL